MTSVWLQHRLCKVAGGCSALSLQSCWRFLLRTVSAKLSDAGSARTAHSHVLYLRCFAVHSYTTAFAVLGPVSGNAATCSFPRLLERRRSNLCRDGAEQNTSGSLQDGREQEHDRSKIAENIGCRGATEGLAETAWGRNLPNFAEVGAKPLKTSVAGCRKGFTEMTRNGCYGSFQDTGNVESINLGLWCGEKSGIMG